MAADVVGTSVMIRQARRTELLRLADEVAQEGLFELLGGLERVRVSRWTLMKAPRRVELSPALEALLVIGG